MSQNLFHRYQLYFGDLHNHCRQVGYGYGSVEDALRNARAQLDFTTVTAHASWHDLDRQDPRLADIVRYSLDGFQRAMDGWDALVDLCEDWYTPGEFVTFPSFEWHSSSYGDRVVLYQGPGGEIFEADSPEAIAKRLGDYQKNGLEAFLIPHHIGYPRGSRGIDWAHFTPAFSPIVEIVSMHGAAESEESPRPYLHTMGPLDRQSAAQAGLEAGYRFGMVGSTDHHSAHPGSYGSGRMGVWAEGLTRESLWEAIKARRVFAVTGDPVSLQFAANRAMMGAAALWEAEREISYCIEAGGAIDYAEVLYCGRVIDRQSVLRPAEADLSAVVKVELEVGWGKKNEYVDWVCELEVLGGQLVDVVPHFRGPDILSPLSAQPDRQLHSAWEWIGDNKIRLVTQTWGNPTATSTATQGICLLIAAGSETQIRAYLNGQEVTLSLPRLLKGGKAGVLGGFVTPGYHFHQAVSAAEYRLEHQFIDQREEQEEGWYTLRMREKNDQWAWSSPIWFSPEKEGQGDPGWQWMSRREKSSENEE